MSRNSFKKIIHLPYLVKKTKNQFNFKENYNLFILDIHSEQLYFKKAGLSIIKTMIPLY